MPEKRASKTLLVAKKLPFSGCQIPVNLNLLICYHYLPKTSTSEIVKMAGVQTEAVTALTTYLRELLSDSLDFEDIQIGGEDVVVEIDETKLGKRKYHREHLVDGGWVVGGIERTPQKKVFLIEVVDRSAVTLQNVIDLFVLPGSIIFTDCFSSYYPACENLSLRHFTVNHSRNFVDPETGVHTNTIEGVNNGIKHL